MGDHEHQAVDVDPKALDDARNMWDAFVKGGKIAGAFTAVILIFLALTFIKFT